MQKTKLVHHSDYPDFPHHNLILNLFLLILNLVFQKKPLIFLRVPFVSKNPTDRLLVLT